MAMDFTDEVDKALHGTIHYNKIQEEGNIARNKFHFPDKESLEKEKDDIRQKIEKCNDINSIIEMLNKNISINSKVLEADIQFLNHYLKHHLKESGITIESGIPMELLESDETLKNLHDLVSHHGAFGNFLVGLRDDYSMLQSKQILTVYTAYKHQAEPTDSKPDTSKTIDSTDKPWASNYRAVYDLCNDFDRYITVLRFYDYIVIDDKKKTFAWDFKKANRKDFARFFSLIKKVGQGEVFWRYVVLLFDLAPSNNNDIISKKISTLTKYANNKKYSSGTLDILLETVGLKKNP